MIPLCQGLFKRETRSFRGADGQTAWFKSSSHEHRRTLPNSAILVGLREGDIFMHTVKPANGPIAKQLWLRSDTVWRAIKLGEQMTDSTGKTRVLVINPDGDPAWVLKGTAQKNYSAKKTRYSKNLLPSSFLTGPLELPKDTWHYLTTLYQLCTYITLFEPCASLLSLRRMTIVS